MKKRKKFAPANSAFLIAALFCAPAVAPVYNPFCGAQIPVCSSQAAFRISQAAFAAENFAQTNQTGVQTPQSAFNLATVVDNFLNFEPDSKSAYETLDEKTRQKQEFTDTLRKFNQGNVSVAYNDFANLISEIDNDYALFIAAKAMYDLGFFTLGDVSASKIKNRSYFDSQIETLKISRQDSYPLEKQEEIFLAKAHTSVCFDNTPEETAFDLSKKRALLNKSAYANFVLAEALTESRQYQQALMYLENAIQKNPKSSKYLSYKIEILTRAKKHKEALKFIRENETVLSPEFKIKIAAQREIALSNLQTDENEKKFRIILSEYYNGNYYKVINECRNILNFNKNNYKILTLQGQSLLQTGNPAAAEKNFNEAFALNKNYVPNLIGLGDISFAKKDFSKAEEFYKKALKLEKTNNEALLKLSILYAENPSEQNKKSLAKIQKSLDANLKNGFYEHYILASTVFRQNPAARRAHLVKSIAMNPFFEPAINEYFALLAEGGKLAALQNFLYTVSFSANLDYPYYYFTGVVEEHFGRREDALKNLKRSLALNPDFEPAFKLLGDINQSLSLL